jgi:hypothetical protein
VPILQDLCIYLMTLKPAVTATVARTDLVQSVEDWTDQFLDYLARHVWPKERKAGGTVHLQQLRLLSNSSYFDEKLTQFLFSLQGRNAIHLNAPPFKYICLKESPT